MPRSRTPAKQETAREVAVDILQKKGGGPIKVGELAKLVVDSDRTKLSGKTPAATVSAHIYTAAAKGLLFRKTGRGEVELLDAKGSPAKTDGGKAKGSGSASKGSAAKKSGGRGRSARKGKPVPTDDVTAADLLARGEELPEPTPDGGERPSEAAMRMADEAEAAEAAGEGAEAAEPVTVG